MFSLIALLIPADAQVFRESRSLSAENAAAVTNETPVVNEAVVTDAPEGFRMNSGIENSCPTGYRILSESECKDAARHYSLGHFDHVLPEYGHQYPRGCFLRSINKTKTVFFNKDEAGGESSGRHVICANNKCTSDSQCRDGQQCDEGFCTENAAAVTNETPVVNTAVVTDAPEGSWMKCADENRGKDSLGRYFCQCSTKVRYGDAATNKWTEKDAPGGNRRFICQNDFFFNDPLPGVVKTCQCYVGTVDEEDEEQVGQCLRVHWHKFADQTCATFKLNRKCGSSKAAVCCPDTCRS